MTALQSFEVASNPADAPPRVAALRDWMAAQGLDAFLVPRADRFRGEYVAPCDERLAWITGFTGSAGFAVILRERAAIFVDGRYTAQVRAQTDAETFEYVDWPATKLPAWLADAMPAGGRLGFDPWLHSLKEIEAIEAVDGLRAMSVANGVDAIWADRPAPPGAPAVPYPERYAGRSAAEKRGEIAEALSDKADAFLITRPEAICWLLNMRGGDIARTPLVHAMGVIHGDGSVDLLAEPGKFAALDLGTEVRISDAPEAVLPQLGRTGFDPEACPVALHALLAQPVAMTDPLALPAARKTPAELDATRGAHLRDAAAMVRFLRWLDQDRPGTCTEIDAARALEGFRRETGALRDISFETISGAGPNGAIVHYRVNTETNRVLEPDSLYLVDSGGQYEDGTTDITRTVAIGTPPAQAARDFTRVLQGMIAVSRARFPKGVAGAHLDALARAPLWAEHKDYDHGTGHGVGVYLGVHEGPARISRASTLPLEPGMILSNEPGYYKDGAYGIRIENLVIVREATRPEGGDDRKMLDFETLTWVPIDRHLIVTEMLSPDELRWINDYHEKVFEKVSPVLSGADRDWLAGACAAL